MDFNMYRNAPYIHGDIKTRNINNDPVSFLQAVKDDNSTKWYMSWEWSRNV